MHQGENIRKLIIEKNIDLEKWRKKFGLESDYFEKRFALKCLSLSDLLIFEEILDIPSKELAGLKNFSLTSENYHELLNLSKLTFDEPFN